MKTTNTHRRSIQLATRAALALGVAGVLASQIVHATDGTWANPTYTSGTFTGVGSGGQFTFSGTALTVGDVIQATQAASGLANNTLYYVVGVSGTTYTLSATPGGTPLTTSLTTTVTFNAALDWSSTASWTSGSVPGGTDAVATIATVSGTPNSYNIIIDKDVTVGQIIATQNNKQWSLVSSNNNGTGTALAALNFATTGATPGGPLIQSSSQLLRIGFQDASFKGGTLKITGTQGLTLVSGASTEIRLETIDWSGFTNGSGGAGTVTVQSGKIANMGNGLGSSTTCTNLVVGNASSSASAKAEMAVNNQGDLSVNNLDGNQYGYVSGPTSNIKWMFIGQRNGTNTDFAGTIGTDRAGTAAPVVLVKNGTGTQTISGTFANGTLTINAGGMVLSGNNTYAGGTTLAAGATLSVNSATALGAAAGAIVLNGGTIDNTSGGAITLTNNQAITLGGNLAYGGTRDLNLGSGAITNAGSRTITLNGTGKTFTLGGVMTNSQGAIQTTTVNGSGNTLAIGGYALSNTATSYINVINGSGNVNITGEVSNGGTATTSGLTYSGTGTLTLGGNNTYGGGTTISSGTVKTGSSTALGSGAVALSGATATLDLNGQSIGNTLNISAAATLANSAAGAAALTTDVNVSSGFTVNATGDITATRLIGLYAPRTITKLGGGTLTTNGTSHNNLTAWDIQAGTVVFANTSGYGADRGVTLNGGTLKLSGLNSNLINDGQSFTINTGVFDLNGKSEAVAAIGGTGGTIRNTNASTATLYVGGGISGTSSANYSGMIENGTGTLNVTKEGTGKQTLGGNNTYTGTTTVSNGTLEAASGTAFGTSSIVLSSANGTLDLGGQSIGNTISISAAANLINSLASAAALSADTGVTSNFTVNATGNITATRFIATGVPRTITKLGAGTLTTNGNSHNNLTAWDIQAGKVVFANTSGYGADRGVTLNGGTLQLSGANTNLINDEQAFTVNTGIFDLNGKSETVAAIGGTGGTIRNDLAATSSTLTVGGNNTSASYAGTITNGNGTLALTKTGTGTQTLTGTNTYTGATNVNGGTLVIDGSVTSDVTVGSAGTLMGIGTITGDVTVNGTHAPGNSPGTQAIDGNLTYASASIFQWDLNATNGADPGVVSNSGTYDKVTVTGDLTGSSAVFQIVLGSNAFTDAFWNTDKDWTDIFSAGNTFDLGTIFTSFSGSGVASNGTVTGQGSFTLNGTSLSWTAVPEPTSAVAGLLLGAGLLRRRRMA